MTKLSNVCATLFEKMRVGLLAGVSAAIMSSICFVAMAGVDAERAERPRICTDRGCESGFFVNIPKTFVWRTGIYRFEFQLDQRMIICQSRSVDSSPVCNTRGVEVMIGHATETGFEGYSFRQRDPALPPEEDSSVQLPVNRNGFAYIRVDGKPTWARVSVSFNGKLVAFGEAKVKYSPEYPNGKECGAGCVQGYLTLSLK